MSAHMILEKNSLDIVWTIQTYNPYIKDTMPALKLEQPWMGKN